MDPPIMAQGRIMVLRTLRLESDLENHNFFSRNFGAQSGGKFSQYRAVRSPIDFIHVP